MAEEKRQPKLEVIPTAKPAVPSDATDFDDLWLDPGIGDGIVTSGYHSITVDKPKAFFRTHPHPTFRRRTEVYTHKPEGVIDKQHFIVAPSMRGLIEEATPCTLVCVVYRDGVPRLWPIKFPKEGRTDNETWKSERSAANAGISHWVRIVWTGRVYEYRKAEEGYAPNPDWSALPPWKELIKLAFGVHGVIRDKNHVIYRELTGAAPKKSAADEPKKSAADDLDAVDDH
jgi:hypothetical protein